MANKFLTWQNQNMQQMVKEEVYKLLIILLLRTRIKIYSWQLIEFPAHLLYKPLSLEDKSFDSTEMKGSDIITVIVLKIFHGIQSIYY